MKKQAIKITESASRYRNIEKMSFGKILENINKEDSTVAKSVSVAIPLISSFVPEIVQRLLDGGRLFYIGAGTSGRLGIVDASECPPTFGVPGGMIIGIIAGGDGAIRKAVEFAEDDDEQGWKDLTKHKINKSDVIIGLTASGTTPYVVGALRKAASKGILTGAICCNTNGPLSEIVDYPIEVTVGPEFITGSTRMKSGTAQKMVLNMISTSVMIGLGRIVDNKMVDMQLTNNKLIDRGIRMIMEELKVNRKEAGELLALHKSVRKVMQKKGK